MVTGETQRVLRSEAHPDAMIDLDLVLAGSVIAAFAAAVSAVVLVPSHAVELARARNRPRSGGRPARRPGEASRLPPRRRH
jgi:hypothetical protein